MSNLIWDQNVFMDWSPLPSTAFPFSRTMHSLPLFFASVEGQRKQEIGAKWGRKLPKSDHKLVSKGGKRSKEGSLGGTLTVGQVRQRIPLPATRLRCQVFRTLWHLGTRPGSNHLAGAHNPLPSNNHLSQIHPLARLPLNYSL